MFQELWFYINTLGQLFSIVHWSYACPSPLYLLKVFKHEDLTVISSKSSTQQRDLLKIVLFTLAHFLPFMSYYNHPFYLCFSLISKWYTHNLSYLIRDTNFFAIIRKVYNNKTFIANDEMCNLVSTNVKLVFRTFSRFFYTWVWYSYSRCSNGFFAICGVFHIKNNLGKLQHNN
jgi:hypothetical protein